VSLRLSFRCRLTSFFAFSGDHSGRLLATASKAQSAAAAAIWLWDVDTWQPVGQLSAHQLTVTQLEFSPNDDRFLLAVSRDRHLSLWERTDFDPPMKSDGKDDASAVSSTGRRAAGDDEMKLGSKDDETSHGKSDGIADAKGSAPSAVSSSGGGGELQAERGPKHEGGAKQDGDDREEEGLGSWIKEGSYLDRRSAAPTSERGPLYRLVAKVEAHKRIVWAASWAPDGCSFATGSRDKLVKLWGVSVGADGRAAGVRQVGKLPVFSESVTALAWGARGILAVGLENGGLELWQGEPSGLSLTRRFEAGLCHVAAVQRIRWKSGPPLATRKVGGKDLGDGGRADGKRLQLATCGADHAVRIFSVELP
jgi:WD40 repeat protein